MDLVEVALVGAVKFFYKIFAVLDAVAEHHVRGVVVGADKVERKAVLIAEFDHVGDVCVVGRRRAADAKAGVDLFDRRHGDAVEFIIILHRTAPEASAREPVFAVEIGFVPDLEIPAPHFIPPVPLDQVRNKLFDEPYPDVFVPGRRDVCLIVEDGLVSAFKAFRHEPDLDEGLHADREEEVVDVVDIGEREQIFGGKQRTA